MSSDGLRFWQVETTRRLWNQQERQKPKQRAPATRFPVVVVCKPDHLSSKLCFKPNSPACSVCIWDLLPVPWTVIVHNNCAIAATFTTISKITDSISHRKIVFVSIIACKSGISKRVLAHTIVAGNTRFKYILF